MTFVIEIEPRFDYGRASHTVEVTDVGAVFTATDGMELTVHTAGLRAAADGGATIERTCPRWLVSRDRVVAGLPQTCGCRLPAPARSRGFRGRRGRSQ